MSKIIVAFGVALGFCAVTLPFSTNAEQYVEIKAEPITFSVTINEYYELSVISNTGGEDVSYSEGTYSGTMVNGTAHPSFGTTVLGAIGNNANGWKIQAKSSTNNGSGAATMVGANTGLVIPSSSNNLDGSVSTWTMRLAANAGSPTIATGFDSAHTIPATDTTVVTGECGDSHQITVIYGIGVGPTQAADTYSGSIEYTLSPNA